MSKNENEFIRRAMSPQELVPMKEIEAVWGNANFGDLRDKRQIVDETMQKFIGGYAAGYTATEICISLGLLRKSAKTLEVSLTKKGMKYAFLVFRRMERAEQRLAYLEENKSEVAPHVLWDMFRGVRDLHCRLQLKYRALKEELEWKPIDQLPDELKNYTSILVGWWEVPDPEEPVQVKEYGDYIYDPAIDYTKPYWVQCISQYEDLGYRRGFNHRNGACKATHFRRLSEPERKFQTVQVV